MAESLRDCRILVAEDEYFIAEELKTELSKAGAVVLGPVATLERALALIAAEQNIQGAVLDINLRGVKVYPAADRLAERRVPTIFMTGYDQSVIPAEYSHIARCEKPVIVSEIAAALRRAAH